MQMRLIGKLRDIKNTHKCLNECLSLTIKANSQVVLHRLGAIYQIDKCDQTSQTTPSCIGSSSYISNVDEYDYPTKWYQFSTIEQGSPKGSAMWPLREEKIMGCTNV